MRGDEDGRVPTGPPTGKPGDPVPDGGAVAPIRIVLADDHAVLLDSLKFLISGQPGMEVVGEAADGEAACRLARELCPDVVVMDLAMPRLDGVRATEQLLRDCPAVRVLALTMYEERGFLKRVMQAGASGYVLKRSAAEELIRAIRAVATGGVYVDPALAGKLLGARAPDAAARPEGPESGGAHSSAGDRGLSAREAEVLRLIARGHGTKEIAAELGVGGKSVETYRARSMEKLGLRSRADIVRFALQQGWLSDL